ncbi:MAG: hypothetical protein JST31_06745 [Actinobacteria bacterium]|nr:hypothetical protein [Actinomycetota bacterium]
MEMDDHLETLVVAARTAEHPRLVAELRRHARGRAVAYTLLVPALPSAGEEAVDLAAGWSQALSRAERAARTLREAGLDLREAIVGDPDCAAALGDVLHAREFDEVLLATPQWVGSEPHLKLQRIANTSLRFRSPRLGAFLRSRSGAGVTLQVQKAAPRWRDDARTRTRPRSARARAVAVPRSSS